MRVVLATTVELLSAATGRPITVRTLDGEEVQVRLPTFDEYRAQEAESRAWFESQGLNVPRQPDDSIVRALVRPLPMRGL